MHKILLISDSHGERKRIQQVCKQHPHMEEYIHLGDLGFAPDCLAHFTIVRGNHDDASYHLPNEQILDIEDCKILLLHGHQLEMCAAYRLRSDDKIQSYETFMEWMEEEAAQLAKQHGCNVVFHGHTHLYLDKVIDGVRIINPGSLFFNRDGKSISYACVTIEKDVLQCDFTLLPMGQ